MKECKTLGKYRFFIHLGKYVYVFGEPSNIFPEGTVWPMDQCFTKQDMQGLEIKELTFIELKAESTVKDLRYSKGPMAGSDYTKVIL